MAKKELDTKKGFLYEVFAQMAKSYADSIEDVYNDLFAKCTDDSLHHRLTPAEYMDDVAMIMYEIEDIRNGEETD